MVPGEWAASAGPGASSRGGSHDSSSNNDNHDDSNGSDRSEGSNGRNNSGNSNISHDKTTDPNTDTPRVFSTHQGTRLDGEAGHGDGDKARRRGQLNININIRRRLHLRINTPKRTDTVPVMTANDDCSPARALSVKVRLKVFRRVGEVRRDEDEHHRRRRLLEEMRVHVAVPQRVPRLSSALPPGPLPIGGGVVIIGAGVFGLSTALTMARMSMRPIQVIEAGDGIGNQAENYRCPYQLHTPLSYDYPTPGCGAEVYQDRFISALAGFSEDELIRDYLCVQGYAKLASVNAPVPCRVDVARSHAGLRSHPVLCRTTLPFGEEAAAAAAAGDGLGASLSLGRVNAGDGDPVSGYVNLSGGMIETADLLYAMFLECQRLGVRFHFNEPVEALWWEGDRCVGVSTNGWAGGRVFHDDAAVIVAAGASIPAIIPSSTYHAETEDGLWKPQFEPIAYATAHLRLSKAECLRLRHMPVLHMPELGYVCPPDPQTQLMQVAASSIEFVYSDPVSCQLRPHPDVDRVPAEGLRRMRELLRQTLPSLAARPLLHPRLNWTTKTADGDFVMDKLPGTDNVFVAAGDVDKSVGMLPILGREVTDLVMRGEQWERRWRWKAGDYYEEFFHDEEMQSDDDGEEDGQSGLYYIYEYDPDIFLPSDDELSDSGVDLGGNENHDPPDDDDVLDDGFADHVLANNVVVDNGVDSIMQEVGLEDELIVDGLDRMEEVVEYSLEYDDPLVDEDEEEYHGQGPGDSAPYHDDASGEDSDDDEVDEEGSYEGRFYADGDGTADDYSENSSPSKRRRLSRGVSP